MSITRATGNLLTQDVDALVNTVNLQGVMGKGIALQFKKAWPDMFKAYEAACKRGEITPGRMHVWETGHLSGPRFIINFPTKRHWRGRSKMGDIEVGLANLVTVIQNLGIRSIAIPPLGCGNGGLNWRDVEPRIREALKPLVGSVDIRLFSPAGAPPAADQPVAGKRPTLTSARAALLALMREYERTTFEPPTLIAIQKLAYFLQLSGQELRLNFKPHLYGPYADELRKSLRTMEGFFITGFGDGSASVTQADPIQVRRDAEDDLDAFLDQDPETRNRISEVLDNIEGFESSYGLELLSTVHWLSSKDAKAQDDVAYASSKLREWNPRKSRLYREAHVEAAWNALRERQVVGTHASREA